MGCKSVPELIEILHNHQSVAVRIRTVRRLAELEDKAESAIPVLLSLLHHENMDLVQESVEALNRIESGGNFVIGALLQSLLAPEEDIRMRACLILDQLIPDAREAIFIPLIPTLEEHLENATIFMRFVENETEELPDTIPYQDYFATLTSPPVARIIEVKKRKNALNGTTGFQLLRAAYLSKKENKLAKAFHFLVEIFSLLQKSIPPLIKVVQKEEGNPFVELLDIFSPIPLQFREKIPIFATAYESEEEEVRFYIIGMLLLFKRLFIVLELDEVVPTLIQALKDPIDEIRLLALTGLEGSEERAKEAIPFILRLLHNSNPDICYKAIEILSEIGPDSEASEELKLIFREKNSPIREEVLSVLGEVEEDPMDTLQFLLKILESEETEFYPVVLMSFINILTSFDSEVPETKNIVFALNKERIISLFSKGLQSKEQLTCEYSAFALAIFGTLRAKDPDIFYPLNQALNDEKEETRYSAAMALIHLSAEVPKALPVLLDAFKKRYEGEQEDVGDLLRNLGEEAKDSVPFLLDMLQKEQNEEVLYLLIEILSHIGSSAKAAIPFLLKLLEKEKLENSEEVYLSLAYLGPTKEALPFLIEGLKDKKEEARCYASYALQAMGTLAQDAYPALLKTLKDSIDVVRVNSILALGKLRIPEKREELIPLFLDALKDSNAIVRQNALCALEYIQASFDKIPEEIIACLDDENKEVRQNATWCLIESHPKKTKELAAFFISALEDDFLPVCENGMWALGRLGIAATDEYPLFKAGLNNENLALFYHAGLTFAKLERNSKNLTVDLIAALKNQNWFVRKIAARKLSYSTSVSDELIVALQNALHDPEDLVCIEASLALKSITGMDYLV